MMRRSRVGSTIDLTRLAAGLARPGIDPRIWYSLAFAMEESKVDAKHGHMAAVQLLPSGVQVTVRVPQGYAGNGFGQNKGLIHKDDELIIAFPDGDPATGGIVQARLWSAADPPPALVSDNPGDMVDVLESGKNIRQLLSGGGEIQVEGDAEMRWKTSGKQYLEAATVTLKTGNVRLGDEGATEQVIKGTTYRTQETVLNTENQAAYTLIATASGLILTASVFHLLPIVGPMIGAPILASASALLISATAQLIAANVAFEAAGVTYLSTVSKTS
jgi:hypothetical protein